MIDSSFLVGCSLLGIIGWFTYKVYIWPYYVSPLRKIPGPPSESLLLGNFQRFFVKECGELHIKWVKKYGNFAKYHGLLNEPVLLVTDTKMIQEIVSTYDFPKPQLLLTSIRSILGQGLAVVDGEIHKRQRKMMNPAFSFNNVKDMVPTFVRVASTLKGLIEDKVNRGESRIILTPYISKATLDIIGIVGFNHEFNSLTSPSELAEAYSSLMNNEDVILNTLIGFISYYLPFVRKIPMAVNKRFNGSCKVAERESKKLIEERDHDNRSDGKDLLSLLINVNKTLPKEERMTNDELKYQIMTFLFAGHETTSTSTSWALYILAQHPSEQDLLREELVKAFPDKSKFNPTFDEINSLEYLNCIIKETLRLFPPAINVVRSNAQDKILCGHFIPKDTLIDIPIATLHRLPSIWGPTADDFVPKRWLDPSLIKDVTNLNYLPFYTGIRSCIGSKVALNEFKVLLSYLVRNFAFQPVEGFHIGKRPGFLNKPDPYLELMVSKVEV